LKTDIHQTRQAITIMQKELAEKQKKADEIEKIIDEKTSLLKVSEFIQNEKDKTELVVLIDEMHLGEFDNFFYVFI
jgi:hypothetical protein